MGNASTTNHQTRWDMYGVLALLWIGATHSGGASWAISTATLAVVAIFQGPAALLRWERRRWRDRWREDLNRALAVRGLAVEVTQDSATDTARWHVASTAQAEAGDDALTLRARPLLTGDLRFDAACAAGGAGEPALRPPIAAPLTPSPPAATSPNSQAPSPSPTPPDAAPSPSPPSLRAPTHDSATSSTGLDLRIHGACAIDLGVCLWPTRQDTAPKAAHSRTERSPLTSAATSPTHTDPHAQIIEHYGLLRLLGSGGMGEVYLARDLRLGRKVALKMIREGVLGGAAERFMEEARITAQFNHPHIVTVYGVGEHAGRPYVALEYLDGVSLRERMLWPLPEREVMRLGLAIGAALEEAHAHGVLHRDLKPENVMIPSDGRLRVVDFGLAGHFKASRQVVGEAGAARHAPPEVEDETISMTSADLPPHLRDLEGITGLEGITDLDAMASAQTMGGSIVISAGRGAQGDGQGAASRVLEGTPLYMAPEQWMSKPCTAAADIWALGLMLAEMVTGEHPYGPDAASEHMLSLCMKALGDLPLDVIGERVGSAGLRGLIATCLAKDPEARPSAQDVVETLRRLLEPRAALQQGDESPFRGLLAMGEQQAAAFFGREDETLALVERLRDQALVAVVGPSGVGKSSLVLAGVIPRLREGGAWRVMALRPGRAPLRALAGQLGFAGPWPAEAEARAQALHDAPGRLSLWLQQHTARTGERCLLFVDQMEEAYTQAEDAEEGRQFIEALCAAADEPSGPTRAVVTLRDDFLGRLAEVPAARAALQQTMLLGPPSGQMLHAVITQTLQAARYTFDEPRILDQMLAAVRGEAAALPLLQVTGQALWERRDRQARTLRAADYAAIGGVEGALAAQADAAIQGLSRAELDLARVLLLRLVTAEGTRRTAPTPKLLSGLAPEAEGVLQRLIQARLLTALRGAEALDGGADTEVELAHESLLRTWQRLRRWREDAQADLSFADELERAAALWDARGRAPQEAWQGDALWQAVARAAPIEATLSEAARAFLGEGRARARAARRRRLLMWLAIVAALAVVAAGALRSAVVVSAKNRDLADAQARADALRAQADERRAAAEAAKVDAEVARADALQEAALGALERGDTFAARAMTRAALEVRDDLSGRALWMRLLRTASLWRGEACELYGGEATAWASPSSLLTLCASFAVSVLDTDTGARRRLPLPPATAITRAAHTDRVAIATNMGQILIFDHIDQIDHLAAQPSLTLQTPDALPPDRLALSADGLTLAATSTTIRFPPTTWDLSAPTPSPITYQGHTDLNRSVTLSPAGDLAISLAERAPAHVWNPTTATLIATLTSPLNNDLAAAFSPDGARAAIASQDGSIRLYDARAWRLLYTLPPPSPPRPLWSLAFSPDGHTLASGGLFVVDLWRTHPDSPPSPLASIPGHLYEILSLSFSPDGDRLASTGADGPHLWNLHPDALRLPPQSPDRAYLTRCAPDGAFAATIGMGPVISLWDTSSGLLRASLQGHTEDVYDVAFSPEGLLASTSTDHTIRTWSTEGRPQYTYALSPPNLARRVSWSESLGFIVPTSDGLFALRDGQARPTFPRNAADPSDPRSVFSSAAGVGLSGLGQPTLSLWRLFDGLPIAVTPAAAAPIINAAFSPDGHALATASVDGTFSLYQLDLSDADPSSAHITLLRQWSLPDPLDKLSFDIWLELAFSPRGDVLAITADDHLLFWDLEGERLLPLSGKNQCGGCFSGDGGRFYGASCSSGALLGWDMTASMPLWSARALLAEDDTTPPALLTSRGWQPLLLPTASPTASPAPSPAPTPPATPFHDAAAARGLLADAHGGTGCLFNRRGELEVWRLRAPTPQRAAPLAPITRLAATASGCFALTITGEAWHLTADAPPLLLAQHLTTADLTPHHLLAINAKSIQAFSPDGRAAPPRPHLTTTPAFAAALTPDLALLIDPDGALSWRALPDLSSTDATLSALEGPDALAATRLIGLSNTPITHARLGPSGTLILGLIDGHIELWSLHSGRRLDRLKLLGSPAFLTTRGDTLLAASGRGDLLTLNLQPLSSPYCAFLSALWARQPATWLNTTPSLTLPPPQHPCLPRRD